MLREEEGIVWREKRGEERSGGGGSVVGASSGDLPRQHAVNQSDLDRTGTHLVTAPANTGMAGKRKTCA